MQPRTITLTATALSLAAALLTAGCKVAPPPDHTERIPITPPPTWTAPDPAAIAAFSDGWLADFNDPTLTQLVQRALISNYDLKATASRLESFRANAVIGSADLYPAISAGADASRRESSSRDSGALFRSRGNSFGLDLAMSWEIDIWGRLRDRAQAAIADFQASAADLHGARLSLAAQVTGAWFDALEAELQVRLAQLTLQSFDLSLQTVEERYRRGVDPDRAALDVRLTRSQVGSARSTLEFRKRQRDASVRFLQVLLGDYPDAQLIKLVIAEADQRLAPYADQNPIAALGLTLPAINSPVPAGLPSNLLRRRPDLIRAERVLAANDARISAAEKDLLPQIRLTASTGTSSEELRNVLNPDFSFWSIAGSLSQPLFQGRRLVAAVDRATADYLTQLNTYAQTALQAFREVETALAAEQYLASEQDAVQYTAAESLEAERLATDQYNRGIPGVDIITVLESQRRSFSSQQQVISIANQRLQNRISIYLALGGDFHALPESPDQSQPAADPQSNANPTESPPNTPAS